MLDVAKDKPESLASLRMFFCGGTTVSPDLIRQASAAFPGCLFFRCYGSTEMLSATLGIHDRAQAELGAETDGEIVFPVEMRILDANTDAPLPQGEEGEIIARGPGLFAGYLHPSGSRTDSPGIRRDVIQRADHTEERSYGSAQTGGFDAADFARRVDAAGGDVTAAVREWLVETERIQADAHILHLEVRTWRPR